MDKKDVHQFAATLKGCALVCLVETGVIERDENGDVDTEAFERFWTRFDRNLNAVIENEVGRRFNRRRTSRILRRIGEFAEDHGLAALAAFWLSLLAGTVLSIIWRVMP